MYRRGPPFAKRWSQCVTEPHHLPPTDDSWADDVMKPLIDGFRTVSTSNLTRSSTRQAPTCPALPLASSRDSCGAAAVRSAPHGGAVHHRAAELLVTLVPGPGYRPGAGHVGEGDGTLLPIDRIAADRPFYSGKHKKHGMNVQDLADRPVGCCGASPALPGAVHDVQALREHDIVRILRMLAGIPRRRGTVRVLCWGGWKTLSQGQKAVDGVHVKIRALVERAVATLRSWRLRRELRCSTTRVTNHVRAVVTLHATS